MKTRQFCTLLTLVIAGCGTGGPELADVSGHVTLDGKPVPNATLRFLPQAEGASTSSGRTDAEGYYELRFTRDKMGAMPGTYRVQIETERLTRDELENMRAEGLENVPDEVPEYVKIPAKYDDPGTLPADVKSGDNTINFPLTSD